MERFAGLAECEFTEILVEGRQDASSASAERADDVVGRPRPGVRIQVTSWPSDRRAVTTSAGTFSFARRRAISHRQGVDPLTLQGLGGVVEGGLDVVPGQLRVVAEDLFGGPTLGQQVEQELDRQPGTFDDRLADQDGWVYHDTILPHDQAFRNGSKFSPEGAGRDLGKAFRAPHAESYASCSSCIGDS